ncbi:MAG: 3'(2'),5'-bisphosphate nucleotidase CysQ [Pseudolabrys sp.]|nr:3'(2'),5'-bisphosphate nucleotidase CysQ [Pseudolabrys sp.]
MTAAAELTSERAGGLIDALSAIVVRGCNAILQHPHASTPRRLKPDGSPVTAADEAAESILLEGLASLLPRVPIVTEERADAATADFHGDFIIVDPLDGTREYLAGRDEYTVNLALIRRGSPVAGIVAAPARSVMWRGVVGSHAERLDLRMLGLGNTIKTRPWPRTAAVAAVSRSHFDSATDAFLSRLGNIRREPCGSALKFGLIAEGTVDVYPRLAPTCEWDVAAGHAIVAAAGGALVTPQGAALVYGRAREKFRVSSFIAWGDASRAKTGAG